MKNMITKKAKIAFLIVDDNLMTHAVSCSEKKAKTLLAAIVERELIDTNPVGGKNCDLVAREFRIVKLRMDTIS